MRDRLGWVAGRGAYKTPFPGGAYNTPLHGSGGFPAADRSGWALAPATPGRRGELSCPLASADFHPPHWRGGQDSPRSGTGWSLGTANCKVVLGGSPETAPIRRRGRRQDLPHSSGDSAGGEEQVSTFNFVEIGAQAFTWYRDSGTDSGTGSGIVDFALPPRT